MDAGEQTDNRIEVWKFYNSYKENEILIYSEWDNLEDFKYLNNMINQDFKKSPLELGIEL